MLGHHSQSSQEDAGVHRPLKSILLVAYASGRCWNHLPFEVCLQLKKVEVNSVVNILKEKKAKIQKYRI
jgi:hypothetical protein